MNLKILKEEKNILELQFFGEGHTLCNLLRQELCNDENISTASYTLKHPLISEANFIITTKSGKAKKHLQETLTTLKKKTKELKAQVEKFH